MGFRIAERRIGVLACMVLVLGMVAVPSAHAEFDSSPPVLHGITLSPSSVATGDSLNVIWDATDIEGVQQVSVNLLDSVGKQHLFLAAPGELTKTIEVTKGWANGEVSVLWVEVADINNNTAWYKAGGHLITQPRGESSHDADLSDTVTKSGTEDVTSPSLSSVSLVEPGPFTAGDPITVRWSAQDARLSFFTFVDSVGNEHAFGASDAAVMQNTQSLGRSWANGPVTLQRILLVDDAENSVYFHRDGTTDSKPGGGGTHDLEFSQLDFVTHDTGADVSPPVLHSLTIQESGPFVEGDVIHLDWVISDDEALGYSFLEVKDASGKSHGLASSEGTSGTLVIDSTWARGTVGIWYVAVYDAMGNRAYYYGDGRRSSNPPGAETHDVDLAGLAFEVQDDAGEPAGAPTAEPADEPTTQPTEEPTSPPSVTFSHLPSAVSGPLAGFGYRTDDSDTPTAQLQISCQLDGQVTACGPDEVTLSSLSSGSHELLVNVVDPEGNEGQTRHIWTVDADAPTPATGAFVGPFTTALHAPVSWSATDAVSGVASFDVRHTSASPQGVWSSAIYPADWQGTTARTGPGPAMTLGRTYCFSARARDHVGNRSGWSAARCTARPLDDRSLSVGRGWTRVTSTSYYGGGAWRATVPGSSVSYGTVKARRIGVLATTCPSCGVVGVFVNGSLVGKLDLASSTTRHRQVRVLSGTTLRQGSVTLKVISSGKPVIVDGLALSAV